MESEVSIITEGNFYSRQRKASTILFKPGYSLAVKMIPISIMTNRLFSTLYIFSRFVKMSIFIYISNDICIDIDASMPFVNIAKGTTDPRVESHQRIIVDKS